MWSKRVWQIWRQVTRTDMKICVFRSLEKRLEACAPPPTSSRRPSRSPRVTSARGDDARCAECSSSTAAGSTTRTVCSALTAASTRALSPLRDITKFLWGGAPLRNRTPRRASPRPTHACRRPMSSSQNVRLVSMSHPTTTSRSIVPCRSKLDLGAKELSTRVCFGNTLIFQASGLMYTSVNRLMAVARSTRGISGWRMIKSRFSAPIPTSRFMNSLPIRVRPFWWLP
mmetsp:Transcript_70559/g.223557  ORF Transcript_70559/g.223557 Transcript_70559/m.223557 type:complete len:228 (-) Transcript_70559:644-1327(-)